jgi:nicotinate phosphoribosyltransferase
MKTLYPEVRRIEKPHKYYVDLSEKLLNLKKQMIREAKMQ